MLNLLLYVFLDFLLPALIEPAMISDDGNIQKIRGGHTSSGDIIANKNGNCVSCIGILYIQICEKWGKVPAVPCFYVHACDTGK